jgi:hypothetical protein
MQLNWKSCFTTVVNQERLRATKFEHWFSLLIKPLFVNNSFKIYTAVIILTFIVHYTSYRYGCCIRHTCCVNIYIEYQNETKVTKHLNYVIYWSEYDCDGRKIVLQTDIIGLHIWPCHYSLVTKQFKQKNLRSFTNVCQTWNDNQCY